MVSHDLKNLFLITGVPGAGKKTLIENLSKFMKISKIIPITTKPPKTQEKDGEDFYFVSWKQFNKEVETENLASSYFDKGNHYGVTQSELDRVIKSKLPILWNISFKEAQKIKEEFPNTKIIFVTAPLKNIRKRLIKKGIISENVINTKLLQAKSLTDKAPQKVDYLIVNEEEKLDKAIRELAGIIQKN